MKDNKALRDSSLDELNENLISLRQEQFKLRVQKLTGQLNQTHLLKQNKCDIARVKTFISKKAGNVS